MSATANPALLAELHHADYIIKVMLKALNAQQQALVGVQLEAAGAACDGITRHHERAAVIAAAKASAAEPLKDVQQLSPPPTANDERHLGGTRPVTANQCVRTPAPVDLDFDEICLITAYRQMRDHQKAEMLSIMQDVAHAFAENPNPVLRAGGAK